jgi:D-alanine-D-alanine ligase
MPQLRVAVLFGGRSGEHEVSLISAQSVLEALDRKKYAVLPVGITLEGRWKQAPLNARWPAAEVLARGEELRLSPAPGAGLTADVVLPILHGSYGEDGTIQGLLELMDIPYVGAGVLGSAAAMDKDIMKRLFRAAGLPIVAHNVLHRSQLRRHPQAAARAARRGLRYPLFVKPANLGSSVGISKVKQVRELAEALQLAARYDEKIIVEQGVEAREIECAVLGNASPQASVLSEIIPHHEFYDYAAKYLETGTQLICPAQVNLRIQSQIQKLAVTAFQAVDCAGLARVDFFLERGNGAIYVNEINTMPGFTPISQFPRMWAASGLPYPRLLDRMIHLALERGRERRRTQFSR